MAFLLPFLIDGIKVAALAAMKPLFLALIRSLFNPRYLLKVFFQLGEAIVKHSGTAFAEEDLAELKKLMQADLDKYLPETKGEGK